MPEFAGIAVEKSEGESMKLTKGIITITACLFATSMLQAQAVRQVQDCKDAGLIAHIEHDGLSFSIRIDAADESFLKIGVPERSRSVSSSSGPAVRLKVLMANDAIIEGPAERIPATLSNGGYDEITYRFSLRKRTVVDDIHSVTIWIGDQSYTVFPF
jgi:hypothetical protein